MFSAILTCRIRDNGDSKLINLLNSIEKNSSRKEGFEVLIKFDSDDYFVPGIIQKFCNYTFKINHLIDRRGRGANDMHLGYTTLMSIARPDSEFFVTLSDDFEVLPEWDVILDKALETTGKEGTTFQGWVLEKLKGTNDVFIVQYMSHPEGTLENKLNMSWDINNIENITGLEIAPAFSNKLIQLCGGFGHVSFTDAWAIMLQHVLYNKHSLNITRFTSSEYAIRLKQGEGMDILEQANRNGQRQYNFELMKKKWYKEILETQAQIVADYYYKYRLEFLERNFNDKILSIDPRFKVSRIGELINKG